jgi:uncharacterized phiE125 gp8 family phage protein
MLLVVTPPAAESLSLADAKAHLQVTHDFEDGIISRLIVAARRWVESRCWRTLLLSTWELTLDRFPNEREIYLPRPRLVTVVSVNYTDPTGEASVLDVGRIRLDTAHEPGRMRIDAAGWPATHADYFANVRIRFTAGWAVEEVPAELVLAQLLLISTWYDNRRLEDLAANVVVAAEQLIAPYRVQCPRSLPYLAGTRDALLEAKL